MSDVTKQIRAKRFQVKKDSEVKVIIESPLSGIFHLSLINCSLHGMGCLLPKSDSQNWDPALETDSILPAVKLSWKNNEYALGRAVFRSISETPAGKHLGLSMIDSRVPLSGPLSHQLEINLDEKASPFDFELDPDKFTIANFKESAHLDADLFAKAHHFRVMLEDWRKTPKYSYNNLRLPSHGARVLLRRPRRGERQDYIIMGSNDYLGMASRPEVMEAAKKAIDQYGFGSTGSALTTGITQAHEELSQYIARILKKEKVLLFNSGYTANVGIINGLTTINDFIAADTLSHASIQDAMQMSRATSRFFKHNDVAHLEKTLQENRQNFEGALVITEGVFSMDGDFPPLKEIHEVSRKYNARLMVDEAHSLGVLGPHGLGMCEKAGLLTEVDLIMGTFSKICGGIGGFVATTEEVADWLYMFARSQVFSVSIPPSTAAAALKALEIFTAEPQLLANLHRNIRHFVKGLRNLGYPISESHQSAVLPVVIGDEKVLGVMNQVLMDDGVFVVPIVYPAVSRKSCRFRFTVMASHTISDLDYVLNTLEKAMWKSGFSFQEKAGSGAGTFLKVA